jgi:protein-S-isoprenylcysteine O-methyltransferase Ste14
MALQEEFESQGNFLFKYRGYLPILILLPGIYVFMQMEANSDLSHDVKDMYRLICLLVGLFGILIRAYTVGHTPKNTSGRNTSEGQIADELNTTGIYSAVRHPLYVGNFFMWLGITMLTQNLWFCVAFIFMYWVYYERIMFAEEQFLRRKFGEPYLNWAAKTPAFMPSLKSWLSPKYPFSIKKVLRNEKAGILYLFLLFFAFDCLSGYVLHGEWELNQNLWFWMFVGSCVYYIIVKLLAMTTNFFEEEGRV